MNWSVDGERRQAEGWIGRTVAAAGQHNIDREVDWPVGGNVKLEPGGHFREVRLAWGDEIGPPLQVARILRGLAVNHARVRGANSDGLRLGSVLAVRKFFEKTLHRT